MRTLSRPASGLIHTFPCLSDALMTHEYLFKHSRKFLETLICCDPDMELG